jgi:SpoVK/Ycf46/Vps4 family AAA+-type ATPase
MTVFELEATGFDAPTRENGLPRSYLMSIPKRRRTSSSISDPCIIGVRGPALARHATSLDADPIELAIAKAVSRFLCVVGRLAENNDFLERALSACGGLLVWPEELLKDVEVAMTGGQARDIKGVSLEDEDEQGPGHRSAEADLPIAARWKRLVDPDRVHSIRSTLFRKMNADASLRRRLGKSTLDWAQAGPSPTVMALENARYMAEAFELGDEGRRLVELVILCELSSEFDDALNQLEFGKRHEVERILALYLGCDQRVVARLVARDGLMARVGLIALDDCTTSIGGLLATEGSIFSQSLSNEHASAEDFLESFLMLSPGAKLDEADTEHLSAVKQLAVPLLRAAAKEGACGTNLMFYGAPGTGKTELARLVAAQAGLRLYEVRYAGRNGGSLSAHQRLASLLLSLQALRGKRDTAILLDEAEDVFSSCERSFWSPPPKDSELSKAWITRLLEENQIPILWTSNRVRQIDAAVLRRFAVVYEFVELPRSVKMRLARQFLGELPISDARLEQIATLPALVPAQLENAARSARLAGAEGEEQSWQFVRLQLNESRRSMRQSAVSEASSAPFPYDAHCLNLRGDMTPLRLLDGLRMHGRAALCFYGLPGTGKTELAHHIARELDRELIVHTASDLLSKWVGDTEQRIADMFHHAAERSNQVVLLLDEADTFLKERSAATTSWESSHTNEFLARMEGFPGIFICTTNLFDRFDRAVVRRFQFRIEFLGMKAEQALSLFHTAFGRAPSDREAFGLKELVGRLAPADFANVVRQLAFVGQTAENADVAKLLAEECHTRGARHDCSRPIGFVH